MFQCPTSRPWQTAIVAITLSMAGCTSAPTSQTTPVPTVTPQPVSENRPQVVATTSILCDITRTIAQETIDLTCLLQPGQDPHTYKPTTGDRKAIEDAQLILYGGYDLEPEIIRLLEATTNTAPQVPVFENAVTEPLMGKGHHHHGEAEHSHDEAEHSHDEETAEGEAPDPHVWHNAQNGVKITAAIRSELQTLNPEHQETYTRNAETLKTQLTQIDTWIKSQISTIPAAQRKLVTIHDSLTYYSDAYGIPLSSLQGVSAAEKPTAANVKDLAETIKSAGIPTIFVETTTNTSVLETVAREANVQIAEQPLYVDSLGVAGTEADTYPKMLISNTRAIVQGLGGQYQPFSN